MHQSLCIRQHAWGNTNCCQGGSKSVCLDAISGLQLLLLLYDEEAWEMNCNLLFRLFRLSKHFHLEGFKKQIFQTILNDYCWIYFRTLDASRCLYGSAVCHLSTCQSPKHLSDVTFKTQKKQKQEQNVNDVTHEGVDIVLNTLMNHKTISRFKN